jgi:phosphate transport system ATP-binding protein
VAYGIRINGMATRPRDLRYGVEESLQHAALWDEVKDRLHESALALSGGSSSGSASRARWPFGPRSC